MRIHTDPPSGRDDNGPYRGPERRRPVADTNDRARQVEVILQQIDHLPTLSPIATRVMAATASDDADLSEIARLIESDPALTVRILSLCRRADRPLVERIETVKRAVVLLGLEAVQSAVLSIAVYDTMERAGSALDESFGGRAGPGEDERGPAFDRAGLWRHLIGVAVASDLIAAANRGLGVGRDEAFVGGLLHDIGRLALELVLPRASERVLRLAERRQADSAVVEQEILGIDHHTAGRRLAERWGLPEGVQQVTWLHSQPRASLPEVEHGALIGIVSVAKALCREAHLGWSGDFGRAPSPAETARAVGVDPACLGRVLEQLHEKTAERCADIGLQRQATPKLLLASIAQANRRLSRLNRSLDERATQAQQMGRVLEEVCAFHADRGGAGAGLTATYGEIVRSARRLMGDGLYAVLDQPKPGADWTVQQFTTDGRVLRCETMRPPAGSEAVGRSLATMTDPSQLSVAAIGLLPWLSDYLGDAGDLRAVKIVPLASGRPAAALLHDRDPRAAGLDPRSMRALLATWASAVQAASRHEQVLRLGEQLASSNRSLAEAHASLTEAESMARLGEMTAGAAHEMNNPLTVIRGRSQLLTTRLTDPGDRAAAAAIAEAASDLSELITSLHLLSDTPTLERRSAPVRELLERAATMARDRAMTGAGVSIHTDADLPDAYVDRDRLAQALCEVIANALQASRREVVRVRAEMDASDDRLVITVEDDGEGLTERARRHAFDPFFSEKPAGRQRGLGLSRAKRLVDLHGGDITLDHAPAGGTRARVSLPADRTTGTARENSGADRAPTNEIAA